MRIGYARTAPGETTLARQRDALIAAGCGIIFEDEDINPAYSPRWAERVGGSGISL